MTTGPMAMKKKSRGFTLVEVAISILLTAIIATAVFSLAITIRAGNVTTDQHLISDQYARELSSMLKSYVTGDCRKNVINGIAAPNNSWSLTGAPSPNSGKIADSCGKSCYALEPGAHTLTNFLPKSLTDPPYNASISYTVKYSGWGGGPGAPCEQSTPVLGVPPSVKIDVNFTPPTP